MQVAKNVQAWSLKKTMRHAQVYDLLLDAALRAQACGPRRGTCNAGCQKFAGFVTQKNNAACAGVRPVAGRGAARAGLRAAPRDMQCRLPKICRLCHSK